MRKVSLLAIVLLLLVALGIAVVAETPEQPGLPAGCRERLDEYLAHDAPPGVTRMLRFERARTPWNLTADMSQAAFGASAHYQTDSSKSGIALPFPPKEVWCVLLERADTTFGLAAGMPYDVVFVGLHVDLYYADWVVHKGPAAPASPQLKDSLSVLGCELGLD
jgi:hypothetical protein